jgi:hypothetical protein
MSPSLRVAEQRAWRLALFLDELAAGDDDVAAFVDLEDLGADGAADVVADVVPDGGYRPATRAGRPARRCRRAGRP